MTGGMCVASCAVLAGSVSDGLAARPEGDRRQIVIEHPVGTLEVALHTAGNGANMQVISAGAIRTARKLMAGEVFVPRSCLSQPDAA